MKKKNSNKQQMNNDYIMTALYDQLNNNWNGVGMIMDARDIDKPRKRKRPWK